MRVLAILIVLLFISGCASQPESVHRAQVDERKVAAHQLQLDQINDWQFQSRMAFINHLDDDRQSASLRWQFTPQQRSIRLSHPLRGTLARVEEHSGLATLTDNQGSEYQASDIQSLLAQHLNVVLPIELIENALLGRLPDAAIRSPRYYPDGTLAEYKATVNDGFADTNWQIELSRYQMASNMALPLPHQLSLQSELYEIRLSISRWVLNQTHDQQQPVD